MKLYRNVFAEQKNRGKVWAAIATALVISGVFASCNKSMFDVSEEFYYRPEGVYLGVADSLSVAPGYHRAEFTWQVKADPRITQTVIYWNNRQDSVLLDVNRPVTERISVSYVMDNLDEGDYIFEFMTKDATGLRSLPRQISVSVLGDSYIGNLRNRTIASIAKQSNGDMRVNWNDIASRAIVYTTVKYQLGGVAQAVRVANADTQTTLQGLQSGTSIQVATAYLPAGSIDTLTAIAQSYTLP
ncbi:DUF4998 domain-containing protein [Niabella drilacis]|uniref:DUF4998 domain-containing protein n=1 Tax=Niabella drilacis (strain DSM 25811 / CCM 8410 / CCUG 62505 / LMG 26954 / E90) TaxID=1285928 RepID=A0A1G6R7P8_NIADE|nr:DUF4998 domain-containing protein [Niabella drilacis]SDD00324.1 protein of unknown function [Niabella drilacis]